MIWRYFVFWLRIHYFSPGYIRSSYSPSAVLEEDKNTYTWMIHKYLPIHNAGSEWMAHDLNKFMIQRGARVNVIVNTSPVTEYERVVLSTKPKFRENEQLIRHSAVLLSHHTMMPHAVHTAKAAKRPLVLLMHDAWQKPTLQELSWMLPKNLYIIHNSKWIQEFYSQIQLPSKVLYPPTWSHEYAVDTSREYVTLVNVNANKGGGVLVEIAKQMPDEKFLGVKGAYNKQVVNLKQKNIEYVEQTPNIREIYEKTGILLMPSKEESWGRTAIEAFSSGIPVIAHPTPGLLESCGSAGIFCDRNDTAAWVREIRRLRTDKDYYALKSAQALARAKELDPTPQLEEISQWISTLRWKD